MSNNDIYDEKSDVHKTQIINNSEMSYSNSVGNMSRRPKDSKKSKNTESKRLKHILLSILIILLATGIISSLQQNKSSNTKLHISASECKNIAKNYVTDDFLSLNVIKKKMKTSRCSAKDSESAINYLDDTYNFNNVAVRKLRLLVEDDNNLTKEDAKLGLENLEFNKQEIVFAINHYLDKICSVKKNDLSCKIEKGSVFSKTNKDTKSKDSRDNGESKLKSSSNGDSDNKNQDNNINTIVKPNTTNKPPVNDSDAESMQATDGNAEQQQENQQPSQTPEQEQVTSPDPQPVPVPQPQSQQLPVVHPGSFCSTAGSQGLTTRGTLMMCKQGANDDRLRWRKVQ